MSSKPYNPFIESLKITSIEPSKQVIDFFKIQRELRDEIIRVFAVPPTLLGGQKRKRKARKSNV